MCGCACVCFCVQWCSTDTCQPYLNTCWIGSMANCVPGKDGWVSQGRNVSNPSPSPTPSPGCYDPGCDPGTYMHNTLEVR